MSIKSGSLVTCTHPTTTTTSGKVYQVITKKSDHQILIRNDKGNCQVISSSRFTLRDSSVEDFSAFARVNPTRRKISEFYKVIKEVIVPGIPVVLYKGDYLRGKYGACRVLRNSPNRFSSIKVNVETILELSDAIIPVANTNATIKAYLASKYKMSKKRFYEFSDGTVGRITGESFPFGDSVRVYTSDGASKTIWEDGKWTFEIKKVFICKSMDNEDIFEHDLVVCVSNTETWSNNMNRGMEKEAHVVYFKNPDKAEEYFKKNKIKYSIQNIEDAFMNYFLEKDITEFKKFLEEIEDIE